MLYLTNRNIRGQPANTYSTAVLLRCHDMALWHNEDYTATRHAGLCWSVFWCQFAPQNFRVSHACIACWTCVSQRTTGPEAVS
jgi:hypothetical protein